MLMCLVLFFNLQAFASDSLVLLDQYFSIQKDEKIVTIQDINKPTDEEQRALSLWHVLHHTFDLVKKTVGDTFLKSLNLPLTVHVDYDEGCNAAWDGHSLMFYVGDNKCISSSLSQDIIVHELGHSLMQNFSKNLETDFNESMADIFAFLATGHQQLAKGFFTASDNRYLRTLEFPFSYPNDWRGAYSGSLIFSTFIRDVWFLLNDNFSEQQVRTMMLKAYFNLIQQIPQIKRPQITNAYSFWIKYLLQTSEILPIQESISKHLDQLLYLHGLIQPMSNFSLTYGAKGLTFNYPLVKSDKHYKIILDEGHWIDILPQTTETFISWDYLVNISSRYSCRKKIELRPLFQGRDGFKRSYQKISFLTGKRFNFKEINLTIDEKKEIPDYLEGVYHSAFSFPKENNETILKMSWLRKIEHDFYEDLRLSLNLNGEKFELDRGIEEREIPNEINLLPYLSSQERQEVRGEFFIEDIGRGFTGKVMSSDLQIQLIQSFCE